MCYENHTQHNGCGHIGPSHTNPWTLCITAQEKLVALRGPNSPPLSSPATNINTGFFSPPKRSSTIKRSFTLNSFLSRRASSTSKTSTSRRAVSGPAASRASTSTSSYSSSMNEWAVTDHEMREVRCAAWECERKEIVSSEMEVCETCKAAIRQMKQMIQTYERTGVVKGTGAYELFLKGLAEWR
ncbi:hypothetical protein BDV96DRAFT_588083 [Lophiotrema nucula]|uniref:Uncharacterized protein n=1 Tax=Lophiotrema nucula TaxID=690887 RepID=A0A6A5YLM6_9PLEO|nr:hypothetical protein BDV96DRAFT_588083 [Lophiotrema nucula]